MFFALNSLNSIDEAFNDAVNGNVKRIEIAGDINVMMTRLGREEGTLLLAGTPSAMREAAAELDKEVTEIRKQVADLREISSEEGKRRLDDFATAFDGYMAQQRGDAPSRLPRPERRGDPRRQRGRHRRAPRLAGGARQADRPQQPGAARGAGRGRRAVRAGSHAGPRHAGRLGAPRGGRGPLDHLVDQPGPRERRRPRQLRRLGRSQRHGAREDQRRDRATSSTRSTGWSSSCARSSAT